MNGPTRRIGVSRLVLATLLALGLTPQMMRADDAANRTIIDYYRRKANLPPEVEASIVEITDAKLGGAKTGTLRLSRGGQSQDVAVVMSPDGKYVVFGEVEDVTADPFKAVAAKIKTEGNPMRGPKDAKVTIVEFSDFQCPYCARAHQTMSEQVMKEFDGKVKLVYKNFPLGFHKWAEPAGIAGECAFEQNPDAFWKYYDYMFANQQQVTPENVKEKATEALKDTKVDMAKWNDCFDNKKTLDKVKADMAEGSAVGVTGTPAFIINGRKISGAQPFQSFKAVIDDELTRKPVVVAARVDAPAAPAPAAAAPAAAAPAAQEQRPSARARSYTVAKGDSLWSIAKDQYGDPSRYRVIFEANRPPLTDADRISPSQSLLIPVL